MRPQVQLVYRWLVWQVYSASGVVWWRVSCSTLYSEGCIIAGGGSHTIAGTTSVESFVDRPHC